MDESIYTLYDRVALARTGGVVLNRSDAAVIRMFNDLMESDERFSNHADDYEIRKIGLIDEQGNITPCLAITVASGAQWRASRVVPPALVKEA